MFAIPPYTHTHTHTLSSLPASLALAPEVSPKGMGSADRQNSCCSKGSAAELPLVWPKPTARVSGSFEMAPGKCPAGRSPQTFCTVSPDLSHGIVQKHSSSIVL